MEVLFALAYGRSPTGKEIDRVTSAVAGLEAEFATEKDDAKRRRKAWAAVCQTVLAGNEFIHVR